MGRLPSLDVDFVEHLLLPIEVELEWVSLYGKLEWVFHLFPLSSERG